MTVSAAFLAVQEYGQRLTNALDGFAAKRRAENVEFLWDWIIDLPTTVAGEVTRRSPYGVAFGLAEGYGAIIVGADGTWDNPVDRGLRFTSDDAADAARARWELRTDVDALAQQARGAFDRTATGPRPSGPSQISRGRSDGSARGRCDGRGCGSGEGSGGHGRPEFHAVPAAVTRSCHPFDDD